MTGTSDPGTGADMSPEVIASEAARIAKNGAALRKRPARETLEQLARVLELFRDGESGVRVELEARLPEATGFTPACIRAGLDLGFAPWTGDALERLYADELGGAASNTSLPALGAPHTALLLAGSIPMPSVLSILLPLAVGSPVLCKPASRDLATAHITAEALAQVDPLLGDCIAITPFDAQNDEASRVFFSAPCVCATGSDETIAAVERRLDDRQRRVLYRHKVSISIVDVASVRADEVEKLALDIALWDQLGCLSPVEFFLVGGSGGSEQAFAAALARELDALEERMPRGELDASAAALIIHERADAEMRAALGTGVQLYASAGTKWTVVLEPSAEPRNAPLHRFVRLVSLPDHEALRDAVIALAPHLAGVGLAGRANDAQAIRELCSEAGASRLCSAGQLQTPPIDWHRDNQPLLLGLTSLAEPESADEMRDEVASREA